VDPPHSHLLHVRSNRTCTQSYELQPLDTTFFWVLEQPESGGGDTLFLSQVKAHTVSHPSFRDGSRICGSCTLLSHKPSSRASLVGLSWNPVSYHGTFVWIRHLRKYMGNSYRSAMLSHLDVSQSSVVSSMVSFPMTFPRQARPSSQIHRRT
jgi:hypothetical protein